MMIRPGPGDVMSDFEITVPHGPLVCGYCTGTEDWSTHPPIPTQLMLGYLELTSFLTLGVGPVGELVVLAEATTLRGEVIHLPHLCTAIPESVRQEYADDVAAILADGATQRIDAARNLQKVFEEISATDRRGGSS